MYRSFCIFQTTFKNNIYIGIEEDLVFRPRTLHPICLCIFSMGNGKEATQNVHQAVALCLVTCKGRIAVGACLNCLAVVDSHPLPEKTKRSKQLLKHKLGIYREKRDAVKMEYVGHTQPNTQMTAVRVQRRTCRECRDTCVSGPELYFY
jgi:hypothetical protein